VAQQSQTFPAWSRWLSGLLVLTAAALLPSCQQGGNFTLFGYTTCPQYDTNIHTVCVPIFKNLTMWRGVEFDLTKAIVREIEAKTPYKVVDDPNTADTILTGTIISLNKGILNKNQQNAVREAETTLAAEVVWQDRRTGDILSRPRDPNVPLLGTPSLPPANALNAAGSPPPGLIGAPPLPPPPVKPTLVQSLGDFIPEIGQSTTTALQENVNHLATQIVFMMEKPW
jgi:hypothetical protein